MVLAVGLLEESHLVLASKGLHRVEQVPHLDPGVPDLEVCHVGVPLHPVAVGGHGLEHRPTRVARGETVVAAGHLDACRESLHIPFERAWRRLVEVVEVEHQPTLGTGERPEVGEMRVTAQPHLEIGRRTGCQVEGHDLGCAPQERERRHAHPRVTQRNEVFDAAAIRLDQHLDRIATVGRRIPYGMCRPRQVRPRLLARESPIVRRRDRRIEGREDRHLPLHHDDQPLASGIISVRCTRCVAATGSSASPEGSGPRT